MGRRVNRFGRGGRLGKCGVLGEWGILVRRRMWQRVLGGLEAVDRNRGGVGRS